MERLQILSGNRTGSYEFIPDSVKIDIDRLEIDTVTYRGTIEEND